MANKVKSYIEGEMLKTFGLTRLNGNTSHSLMTKWSGAEKPNLDEYETRLFNKIYAPKR